MPVLNTLDKLYIGDNVSPARVYAGADLVWQMKSRSALTSDDKGANWTLRPTPYDPTVALKWYSVVRAHAPKSLFVAVSNDGQLDRQIMTSPDGIVWTQRAVPVDIDMNAIAYSPALDKFVAPGFTLGASGNRGLISTDGITWTEIVNANLAALSWRDICWSAEKASFCVVSQTNSATAIAFSPDGTTWTRRGSAGQGQWQSVVWAAGLNGGAGFFVTAGNAGTFRIATAADTSATGFAGRATALGDAALGLRTIGYSPTLNRLVAAGNTGTVRVITSADGINWTDITSSVPNGATAGWADVEWCGDRFIMVAINTMVSSPDGLNWTALTVPQNIGWKNSAYSPTLDRIVTVAQADVLTLLREGLDEFGDIMPVT